MIFREMPRKIKTTPRVAAEEAKKRKDQHEDSDEALVAGLWTARRRCTWLHRARQEWCHRRRARCACGTRRAARHSHGQPGDRWSRVGRTSMNFSLFDTYFCQNKPDSTCSRIGSKTASHEANPAH